MKTVKRTLFLAAIFVSVLLISVAYRDGHPRTRVGDVAPALSFDSEPGEALKALRGKYVLLSFWAATNAPSREAVGRYTTWVERREAQDVGLISFNLDKNETLFHEIVKRDGLNQQLQFRLSESRTERLLRDYSLRPGTYGTLLIAPDGRILAHNPPVDSIAAIIAGDESTRS